MASRPWLEDTTTSAKRPWLDESSDIEAPYKGFDEIGTPVKAKQEPTKPTQTTTPPKKDPQAWRYQDIKIPSVREYTEGASPQNQNSRDMKLTVPPTPDKERQHPAFNDANEPWVQASLDRAPESTRIQNTESPYWHLPEYQQKLVDKIVNSPGSADIETKREIIKKQFGFDYYAQPPYNLYGTAAGMTGALVENLFSRVGTLPPAENANEYAVMGAGLVGSLVPGAMAAGVTAPLGPVAQGVIGGAGANLAATHGNANREEIVRQALLGALVGGFGGYGLSKGASKPLSTANVDATPTQVSLPRMQPEVSPKMQVQMNRGASDQTVPRLSSPLLDAIEKENVQTMRIDDINTKWQGDAPNANGEVQDIMRRIKRGEDIPPIEVNRSGYLQDGRHRLEAYRRLGYKEVPIKYKVYTDEIPISSRVSETSPTVPKTEPVVSKPQQVPTSTETLSQPPVASVQGGGKVDFPESKVTETVYHGSPADNITEFFTEQGKTGGNTGATNTALGAYFSESPEIATTAAFGFSPLGAFSGKPLTLYDVKLNLRKPLNLDALTTSQIAELEKSFPGFEGAYKRANSEGDKMSLLRFFAKARDKGPVQENFATFGRRAGLTDDVIEQQFKDRAGKEFSEWDAIQQQARDASINSVGKKRLKELGYDGIVLNTISDSGDKLGPKKQYVVFDKENIAITNKRSILDMADESPTPPSPVGKVNERAIPDTPVQAIDDAAIPPTDPPRPKSPTLVPVDDTPDAIGLKKAEIEIIRNAWELDRLPQATKITFEETLSRANEENTAARADAVAQRVLAGGDMSDTEFVGMSIRAAQLMNESNELLVDKLRLKDAGDTVGVNQVQARIEAIAKELDTLTRASDMAGHEQSISFGLRRLMVNLEDYSLAKVTNRARERKGSALTDKETARIERVVNERNEIQKQLDEALKRNEELTVKQEEIIAQRVAQAEATRANIRKKAAGSREAIKADRDNIKKQLEAIGYRVNDITGVTTEGAYLVGKLAVSYIREGVTNLAEVVKLVKNDLPDLSDYDIYRAMNTRDPNVQSRMASEATKKVESLKRQARILADIEDASKGIFGEVKDTPRISETIKKLQKRLADLKREAASPILDKNKLARTRAMIDETRKQIAEQYRSVRKAKTKASPELKQARDILKALRKERNTQDIIATLEEKIRLAEDGIFTKSKRRMPDAGRVALLKRQLTKLRNAAYSSGIHPDRLEKAIRTINELQDRIEKHYTPLTRRVKPEITSELAAMKEQIADLRKHLRLEDELADLNEQIRTGEFKVPQKKMRRPESPEIARLRMARDRARNKIEAELEILAPMTRKRVFDETVNALRTFKATADLSATFRQGLMLSVTRPGTAFKAFGKSVQAMFSKNTAEQIDYMLKNREYAYLGERAKLYLADLADARLTSKEEQFMSRAVEKIWGLGAVVRGSERAMVTQLNILRATAFDEFIRINPNATATELKAWADFVNKASGRGSLGGFEIAARGMSLVFFAPRFAASRFQAPLTFAKYLKVPRVRKAIAKDLVGTIALGNTALALAAWGGADVSLDPRDPDWGKIKIGPTRIDIWAGFQQPARLIARIGTKATDELKWTGNDLKRAKKEFDLVDALTRFASYKFAPTLTLPNELLGGRTVIGQKIDRVDALANAVIPMMYEDVFDAYRQQGLGMAALTTGLNLVGVSTNTYQKNK